LALIANCSLVVAAAVALAIPVAACSQVVAMVVATSAADAKSVNVAAVVATSAAVSRPTAAEPLLLLAARLPHQLAVRLLLLATTAPRLPRLHLLLLRLLPRQLLLRPHQPQLLLSNLSGFWR
jgi:hypothetical protein